MSDGAARLSSYPQPKIVVTCEVCGLRLQYDKAAMLKAGGDRRLPDLLRDVARRHGCDRKGPYGGGEACRARFANILD